MALPLLVAERPQGDIEKPFRLHSEFEPAGDQPQAIDELCEGLERGEREQVLLGVTGSGKTFTMAHVIARTGRPAIILAPNKTLAAQIDRMRHSATRAIRERRDVVVVASVSCIYGIGSVETYSQMTQSIEVGGRVNRGKLLSAFVELQYRRNDHNFFRGSF